MTKAKRPYEGVPAYNAGYEDGWGDCKKMILNWINSIKEDNPHYTIEDTSRIINIIDNNK